MITLKKRINQITSSSNPFEPSVFFLLVFLTSLTSHSSSWWVLLSTWPKQVPWGVSRQRHENLPPGEKTLWPCQFAPSGSAAFLMAKPLRVGDVRSLQVRRKSFNGLSLRSSSMASGQQEWANRNEFPLSLSFLRYNWRKGELVQIWQRERPTPSTPPYVPL